MEIPICRALLIGLMVGCTARAKGVSDPAVVPEPSLVSPQLDSVVEAGSLPILVRLPDSMRFHSARLRLDGEWLDDASPVVRKRWWEGKGVDLIARIAVDALDEGVHSLHIALTPPVVERWKSSPGVGTESAFVDSTFMLEPRGPRVMFRAVDGEGKSRSARFQVFDESGELVPLGSSADAAGDPSERDVPRTSLFAGPAGAGEFLAPGTYEVLASGGIRDAVARRTVTIEGPSELVFEVPQVIHTPGEVAADFHVHTAMSSDAFIPDRDRFIALDAAGVDVAVITDHNRVRNPGPPIAASGLEERLLGIAGAEMRLGPVGESYGHANAFPLNHGEPAPVAGDSPPARAFEHWRRHHHKHPAVDISSPLVIQLNHPRGIQFKPDKPHRSDVHALFESTKFRPEKPIRRQRDRRLRMRDSEGKSFLDVDALEVLNRFSVQGWKSVRQDWFELLSRGHRITGTGNSDSHTSQLEPVGFPVNLVSVTEGSGSEGVLEGLRSGRVRVSSGPIVSLSIHGDGQPAQPARSAVSLGSSLMAVVKVDAADWVDVPEVRVVLNGRVVFSEALTEGGPAEWTVPIAIEGDSWVLAEAGWPLERDDRPIGTTYAMVAPGHVPIGFTNPVFLDADGDGEWRPTVERAGPAPR